MRLDSAVLRRPGVAARRIVVSIKDVFQKAGSFATNLRKPAGAVTEQAVGLGISHPRHAGTRFNAHPAVPADFELSANPQPMPTENHGKGAPASVCAGARRTWCGAGIQSHGASPDAEPLYPAFRSMRPARARSQAQSVLEPREKRRRMKILALLLITSPLYAQGSLTLYQSTAPTSTVFNNTNPRYNAWTVMYSYSGSGSFSIELDCAPDATVAGGTPTPGSFTACTATTGSNPSTTPQYGYITFVGYQTSLGSAPWVQLNLTAISSGNLTAFAMGFTAADPEGGGSSGGCAGTAGTPCIVAGPNAAGTASTKAPVQIAGNDGTDVQFIKTDTSGRTQAVGAAAVGASPVGAPVPIAELDGADKIITPTIGTKSAAILVSAASGENQIIALSGSTVIRISHISVGMSAAATVSIDVGTGTNCAGSTATIWGPYPSNTTGFSLDLEPSVLAVPAGDAVCLNFGGTVTAGGGVTYAQY